MSNLSEIYDLIKMYCVGVPNAIMLNAIRRSYKKFCTETYCYKPMISLPTVAAQEDYTLAVPDGYSVISIDEARESGTNNFLCKANDASDMQKGRSGKPQSCLLVSGSSLRLEPTPDDIYIYDLAVYLKPDQTVTTMPDDIFNLWGDGIGYGAAIEILLMPERPWSNAKTASNLQRVYRQEVQNAKNMQISGRSSTDSTASWTPVI